MPDDEDRSVPALAERYELGDVLGAGAAATVYRALDRRSGRQVAVKMFDPQVLRPRRPGHVVEAAALGELCHPGLVELYATGTEDGLAYLVMQLIDGETLSDRIARGPSPVGTVAAVGARLADALAHVHERGLVHRDLKPGNVLLDAEQRPYLADFGVSRHIDATRVTATGFVVGTPAYMAPEQVRGRVVGPQADVYALGLILLEALTGRREYPGEVVESAVARLHRRPAVPAQLPAGLRSLLTAMTADDPDQRPTARSVAVRLAATPVGATVGSTVTDLAASSRRLRRRSAWLAAAAASAVLVAGALGMATAAPRATAEGPSSPPQAAPAAPVVVPPLAAPPPAPPHAGAAALTAAAPRPGPALVAAAAAERVATGSDAQRSRGARSGSTAPADRSGDPDSDRPLAEDGDSGPGGAKNNHGAANRRGAENRGDATGHGGGKGGKGK